MLEHQHSTCPVSKFLKPQLYMINSIMFLKLYLGLLTSNALYGLLLANCVPDVTKFVWKSPCDGQTFPNVIQVTNMTTTQNGQPVDVLGGLDISTNIDFATKIVDNYGTVNKPLIDIDMFEYAKKLGKCQWKMLPTFGKLDNIDTCRVVKNCHLENKPTEMDAALNIKDLAGSLIVAVQVGNYYGLSLTFKDDQKPLLCVYAQAKVLKK